jgi:hypothetical protein
VNSDPLRSLLAQDYRGRRTEEVMAKIKASGEALFTGTIWRAKRCIRVSVRSWMTTDRDVERAVAAIAASL